MKKFFTFKALENVSVKNEEPGTKNETKISDAKFDDEKPIIPETNNLTSGNIITGYTRATDQQIAESMNTEYEPTYETPQG